MTLLDKLIKLRARVNKIGFRRLADGTHGDCDDNCDQYADGMSDTADFIAGLLDTIIDEECVLADEHG